MNTLNLIVSVVAIIASLVSIYINAALKQSIDVKLMQYQSMNKSQEEALQVFYDYENYVDTLADRYGIQSGDDLNKKVSSEEKQKMNEFIYKINLSLAKMFVILPDPEYEIVENAVKLGSMKMKDLKEDLMLAMRKAQFPKSKLKKEDIRFLYKIK